MVGKVKGVQRRILAEIQKRFVCHVGAASELVTRRMVSVMLIEMTLGTIQRLFSGSSEWRDILMKQRIKSDVITILRYMLRIMTKCS